jgi:hypothetical protein
LCENVLKHKDSASSFHAVAVVAAEVAQAVVVAQAVEVAEVAEVAQVVVAAEAAPDLETDCLMVVGQAAPRLWFSQSVVKLAARLFSCAQSAPF